MIVASFISSYCQFMVTPIGTGGFDPCRKCTASTASIGKWRPYCSSWWSKRCVLLPVHMNTKYRTHEHLYIVATIWYLYNRHRSGVVALQMVRRLLCRSTEVVVCENKTHLSVMLMKCWRWIVLLLELLELAFNLSRSSVWDLSLKNPNATKSAADWMRSKHPTKKKTGREGTSLNNLQCYIAEGDDFLWHVTDGDKWVHHHNPEEKDGIQGIEAFYITCNKEV